MNLLSLQAKIATPAVVKNDHEDTMAALIGDSLSPTPFKRGTLIEQLGLSDCDPALAEELTDLIIRHNLDLDQSYAFLAELVCEFTESFESAQEFLAIKPEIAGKLTELLIRFGQGVVFKPQT